MPAYFNEAHSLWSFLYDNQLHLQKRGQEPMGSVRNWHTGAIHRHSRFACLLPKSPEAWRVCGGTQQRRKGGLHPLATRALWPLRASRFDADWCPSGKRRRVHSLCSPWNSESTSSRKGCRSGKRAPGRAGKGSEPLMADCRSWHPS